VKTVPVYVDGEIPRPDPPAVESVGGIGQMKLVIEGGPEIGCRSGMVEAKV